LGATTSVIDEKSLAPHLTHNSSFWTEELEVTNNLLIPVVCRLKKLKFLYVVSDSRSQATYCDISSPVKDVHPSIQLLAERLALVH